MLPDWQIQLNAIETFSKFMTDAEALDLWNKKRGKKSQMKSTNKGSR
ncbi:hypothetical protein GCM10020331_092220 [Ectobacillus funiculus]